MKIIQKLPLLSLPVLILSIPFLVFPLFGLRSIDELKEYTVERQEDTLNGLADSLSRQISDKIEQALPEEQPQPQPQPPAPQQTFPRLAGTMKLDGFDNDWPSNPDILRIKEGTSRENLSYRYYSGIQGKYLYLLFKVQDDIVTYRDTDTLKLDESDHLQIISTSDGKQAKYIAAGYKPGWIVGFAIPDDPKQIAQVERRIHGMWKSADNGYTLEVRIDRALLGENFTLAIADIDDSENPVIRELLDNSAPVEEKQTPQRPFSEAVDMGEILNSADPVPPHYRVRLIDANLQILAETGRLAGMPNSHPQAGIGDKIPRNTGVQESLEGRNALVHYRVPNSPHEIAAALAPVQSEDKVIAVLAIEQNVSSLLQPIKALTKETIVLFLMVFFVSCGGICLYLFSRSFPKSTKSA